MATNTLRQGFNAMTPERQRAIASKGGRSVPAEKRSYSRDPQLAKAAGRLGGLRSAATRART
jgi:general stress protein YciG